MTHRNVALVLGPLAAAGLARAQGTFDIDHCVELGPVIPAFFCLHGEHPYGSTTLVTDGSGREWYATSPAPNPPAGFDRSLLCDFTGFNLYWRSKIHLSGIDDPVASASVALLDGNGQPIGKAVGSGEEITVAFLTTELTGEPKVVIAWNEKGGCYPDCDDSGALNVNDYICFQTKFALGDPYADCDGNGQRIVNDYICFQTSFALGC